MNWISLRKLKCAQGLLVVTSLAFAACSGGPERIEDGIRSDIPAEGPEIGEPEERLRNHLEFITSILSETEDPEAAVLGVGEYLEAHKQPIREDARSIRQRMEQMTVPDRVYYEERFAEFMTPSSRAWRTAIRAFREANPAEGSRVDGIMMYFD